MANHGTHRHLTGEAASVFASRIVTVIESDGLTVDAACLIADALSVPVERILIGDTK